MTTRRCYDTNEQIHRTGAVVERFNEIEAIVDSIIFDYIMPAIEAERFTKTILLSNSIISFGSKVKLIQAINANKRVSLVNRDKLHRLLSIRNAFAHNAVSNNLDIDIKNSSIHDIYFYIESIKGDGSLHRSRRDEAYEEFFSISNDVQHQLTQLLSTVNIRNHDPDTA